MALIVRRRAVRGDLGLWGFMRATATPLHPNPQDVPSVTHLTPLPKWAGAVAQGRQIVRAGLVEQNLPGLSVAVGAGGDVVWAEGFGWRIREPAPVAPFTQFRSEPPREHGIVASHVEHLPCGYTAMALKIAQAFAEQEKSSRSDAPNAADKAGGCAHPSIDYRRRYTCSPNNPRGMEAMTDKQQPALPESADEELTRLRRLAAVEELLTTLVGVLDVREVFARVSEVAGRVLKHAIALPSSPRTAARDPVRNCGASGGCVYAHASNSRDGTVSVERLVGIRDRRRPAIRARSRPPQRLAGIPLDTQSARSVEERGRRTAGDPITNTGGLSAC
jgi:hypothetical protein